MNFSRRPESRQWLKMGAELEGGWTRASRGDIANLVRGAVSKGDGSVRDVAGQAGEINTPARSLLDELCEDIKLLYPDSVNVTCGFHIHTSFSPINTSLIASTEFFNYFCDRWEVWYKANKEYWDLSEFWSRFQGNNQYCRKSIVPHAHLIDRSSDKYYQLNFASWHRIKTVECRLLPMFPQVELALKAVHELSDIYDVYLNNNTKAIELAQEFAESVDGGPVILHNKVTQLPDLSPIATNYERTGISELPVGENIYYAIKNSTEDLLPFAAESSKKTVA